MAHSEAAAAGFEHEERGCTAAVEPEHAGEGRTAPVALEHAEGAHTAAAGLESVVAVAQTEAVAVVVVERIADHFPAGGTVEVVADGPRSVHAAGFEVGTGAEHAADTVSVREAGIRDLQRTARCAEADAGVAPHFHHIDHRSQHQRERWFPDGAQDDGAVLGVGLRRGL